MKRAIRRTRAGYPAMWAFLVLWALVAPVGQRAFAQDQASSEAALSGQVSSQEEGAMEGVVVSAKRMDSTMTISVVSNAKGHYSFPPNRLQAGWYTVRIRAAGYQMDDPGLVEVTTGQSAQLDLHLHPAEDLAAQLSNGEWLASMPGTNEMKNHLSHCFACHHLSLVAQSRHDKGQWVEVLNRMKTYAQSTLQHVQVRGQRPPDTPPSQETLEIAEYLSTVNLSVTSTLPYRLKTFPRPKGKATQVIMTEYDLPRTNAQPHDAVVDSDGIVWYSDFGHQYLGRLDPATGEVVEYFVPVLRPGVITGANCVELDQDGNVWLGMMGQVGIAKFNKTTMAFEMWNFAPHVRMDSTGRTRIPMVMPNQSQVDGKVWTNNPGFNGIHRLDLRTGEIESIDPYRSLPPDSPAVGRPHTVYGIDADSHNNLYLLDFYSEYIARADAKTLEITLFRTPTFDSRPQRGHMDTQDRLWFAESGANRIAMFDTKSEQFHEWEVPTPWTNPYDAVLDKNGEAWTGGMSNDLVVRFNPATGEFVEYLLPRFTNIRRVDVDNSTNPPTFWVGNQLGAAIIKLEPTAQ